MAFDLLGELLHHVDLAGAGGAGLEAVHDLLGPLGTLTARGALAAGLVVVELAQAGDGADHVGGLVHDDDGGRAEPGLRVLEGVEVHELLVADVLGEDRRGRATGNDGLEVVPAACHATGVLLDQVTEGNGHLLFDRGWVVDVTGDTEKLGARVTLAAERVEPVGASPHDGRGDSDGLDVGNSGWAAEHTDCSRERRLQTGLAWLALEGFNKRGLLTANVGAHPAVKENIEIVAGVAGVLAEEASLVSLLDGTLQDGGFVVELATDVNVCCSALKCEISSATVITSISRQILLRS